MRHLAVLLLALLAALPARAGTEQLFFSFGGLKRNFALTVPDGLTQPAPLVLVLHGLAESGPHIRRSARGRFDRLAELYGFIVAYPSAYLRVWDLGEGLGAAQLRPPRDDIAFLKRVIAETRARAPVDPDRIFAAGYSQGGMLSFALACKHPGLIRAVATLAMPLPALLADDCAAAPPEGVLAIQGTEDQIVPFEGGLVPSGPAARMLLLSHDATLAFFTGRAGCGAPDLVKRYDAKQDGTSVIRTDWTSCRRGAMQDYRIEGGGHSWPSGGFDLPFIGRNTREIDGAAAVWGFFSRFR